MSAQHYKIIQPSSLAEALDTIRAPQELPAQPLAGGTDLYVYLNAGTLPSCIFLDLSRLDELRQIIIKEGSLEIGALASFTAIQQHETIRREFPMLQEAGRVVGAVQIQNRATLGGNIANGSPAGDSLPVLLAYDAIVQVISKAGQRQIPFSEFYTGYRRSQMRSDELIEKILLPRRAIGGAAHQEFRKIGTRRAQAISKVVAAFWLQRANGKVKDCRIAYGSVAPTPIRLRAVEAALNGQALNTAAVDNALAALRSAITPIDDVRSTAFYRQQISENILRKFLDEVMPPP
jgi:CO/xanthine dehydrogenase FAD-binding subunit